MASTGFESFSFPNIVSLQICQLSIHVFLSIRIYLLPSEDSTENEVITICFGVWHPKCNTFWKNQVLGISCLYPEADSYMWKLLNLGSGWNNWVFLGTVINMKQHLMTKIWCMQQIWEIYGMKRIIKIKVNRHLNSWLLSSLAE